ncbi:MAG: ribonuclease III, partial [Prevotella sp.]|nr:ribonuclease III [Prevotella sp.]
FKMLKQKTDENGSPIFSFQVMLEGVDGEKGSGYSKKEAQQQASKDTLQRLKREPQFIDAIFAAKTERTKMEEEPAMAVPDTEQEQEFIVSSRSQESGVRSQEDTPAADSSLQGNLTPQEDDFDLSDLSVKPKEKTREDIIAEAEAAAFLEAETEG